MVQNPKNLNFKINKNEGVVINQQNNRSESHDRAPVLSSSGQAQ